MKITDGTQCPSYPVPLDVELKHSIINIVGSNLKWFKAPRKWQKLNIVTSITKCTIFWCSYLMKLNSNGHTMICVKDLKDWI